MEFSLFMYFYYFINSFVFAFFSNLLRILILFLMALQIRSSIVLLTNFVMGIILSIKDMSLSSRAFQNPWTSSILNFQSIKLSSSHNDSFQYFLQSRLKFTKGLGLASLIQNVISLWSPNSGMILEILLIEVGDLV